MRPWLSMHVPISCCKMYGRHRLALRHKLCERSTGFRRPCLHMITPVGFIIFPTIWINIMSLCCCRQPTPSKPCTWIMALVRRQSRGCRSFRNWSNGCRCGIPWRTIHRDLGLPIATWIMWIAPAVKPMLALEFICCTTRLQWRRRRNDQESWWDTRWEP